MKNLIANTSILFAIVSIVYYKRSLHEPLSSEGSNGANSNSTHINHRILEGYADKACQSSNSILDSLDLSTAQASVTEFNSVLFGSYTSENHLETDILNKGITTEGLIDYGKSFIPIVVPWISLWLIGNILNCVFCCNQCCMIGCCKNCCKSCCKCCKKPTKDRRIIRLGSLVLAMASGIGVIGAATAGLISSTSIASNFDSVSCSFFQAFDSFEYGNSSAKWMGLNSASTSLEELKSLFSTKFESSTFSTSTLITNVEGSSDALHLQLDNTYTTNQAKTIPSAKPGSAATVVPDIIAKLGPLTSSSSWIGAIDLERANKHSTAVNSASKIQISYDDITGSLSSYQSTLNDAADTLGSVDEMITNIESTAYDFTSQASDVVSSAVTKALIGVFAGAIGIGALALICPIAVCISKKPGWNSMIFAAWETFFCMSFIGFIVGTIALVIGIVMSQGCDVMYKVVTEKDYVNGILGWADVSTEYSDYIGTCLFDDGDIIGKLGVTHIFDSLYTIQENIDASSSLFQTAGNPNSIAIPQFSTVLDNTISGKYLFVAEPTNSDGTAYNLKNFNLLADHSLSGSTQTGCTVSMDQWVMNKINCTYSSVWDASAGNNDGYNLGSKTCIEVPSTISSDNRYSIPDYSSCTSTTIEASLKDYRTALQNQFTQGISPIGIGELHTNAIGLIEDANDQFMSDIYSLTEQISDLQKDLGKVLTLVSDPVTGMLKNLNCAFFRYSLQNFQGTLCSGLVNTFLQITLCVMLMSMFGCVGSSFQFCFAKYMRAKIEEGKNQDKTVTENKSNRILDETNSEQLPVMLQANVTEKDQTTVIQADLESFVKS